MPRRRASHPTSSASPPDPPLHVAHRPCLLAEPEPELRRARPADRARVGAVGDRQGDPGGDSRPPEQPAAPWRAAVRPRAGRAQAQLPAARWARAGVWRLDIKLLHVDRHPDVPAAPVRSPGEGVRTPVAVAQAARPLRSSRVRIGCPRRDRHGPRLGRRHGELRPGRPPKSRRSTAPGVVAHQQFRLAYPTPRVRCGPLESGPHQGGTIALSPASGS